MRPFPCLIPLTMLPLSSIRSKIEAIFHRRAGLLPDIPSNSDISAYWDRYDRPWPAASNIRTKSYSSIAIECGLPIAVVGWGLLD